MRASSGLVCLKGQSWPLGATAMEWRGQAGVNLAVFSRHAQSMHWCLFDASTGAQTNRLELKDCTDGIWHGFVPGLAVGQLYGLRAGGAYEPAAGHRFNPHKLLLDPYARAIVGSTQCLSRETAYVLDASGLESPDPHDNAERMPKAQVVDIQAELVAGQRIAPGPMTPADQTVLYEAHVKGLTRLHPEVPEALRGTYSGLASAPMLEHYRKLGITTLCLLPVQLHISEKQLLDRKLRNYWGYNTLGYFIPDPAYALAGGDAVRDEFRSMVDQLHRNGLEVVLDVVYNHTAESDAGGPTLSWRGLDNASAYALDGAGHYLNPTGCGNALNFGEPRMVQWVMDSLRWWVQAFGVDGFRFDLATTLGRDPALHQQFNPAGALLTAIAQDPVLAHVKRIAEPWDLGMGGYQVGGFPCGWHEWNDRFRDTCRAFWLGHDSTRGQFAHRLAGSSDLFEHRGRSPLAGINLITSHDGFTLADLTAYRHRRNEANGEHNRDGHSHNLSANAGVEGPTQDAQVLHQRGLWQRALLATLLVAQGTPQLLAGDEVGHSQGGNNNAYCQDNPTTWIRWDPGQGATTDFVAGLLALRKKHPALRHPHWFRGQPLHERRHLYRAGSDIAWRKPDGFPLLDEDWEDPWQLGLACVIEVGEGRHPAAERVVLLFNPDTQPLSFVLPPGAWHVALNSASGRFHLEETLFEACVADASAVIMLVQAIEPLPAGDMPE